jgi:hypothetical protein
LWHLGASAAGTACLVAIAVCVSQNAPDVSAALLYGLPEGWSWLPGFSLLPALLAAVAWIRAGRGRLANLSALCAFGVSASLLMAGWTPLH